MKNKRGPKGKKAKAKAKADIIEALNKTCGIVTAACKACGVERNTYYAWLKEDAEFAKACEESQEIALDMAESALLKQVQAGNVRAIKFYLQCKGGARGYNPRIQMDMNANVNADRPILVFRDSERPKEEEGEE